MRVETDGDRLETLYVGARKSPIQLRCYDKGREIIHGGTKFWMTDIWETESVIDMWRFEFQLRRKVLKEFKVFDVPTLLEKLPGIWDHLTSRWISLRDRSADSCITRCSLHPLWKDVNSASKTFGEFKPVTRERVTEAASVEQLISMVAGLGSSYAARRGQPNCQAAFQVLLEEASQKAEGEWREKFFKKCIKLGIDPGFVINTEEKHV